MKKVPGICRFAAPLDIYLCLGADLSNVRHWHWAGFRMMSATEEVRGPPLTVPVAAPDPVPILRKAGIS